MTLSDPTILQTLRQNFVCGFKNISNEDYAGRSGRHDSNEAAIVTTNGAGPHNVQLFFMSKDGTVLHCLPGYWAPKDLAMEMQFAMALNRVWNDRSLPLDRKKAIFTQANLAHIRQHPRDMMERSHLQSFDAKAEDAKADSDFRFARGDYRPPFALNTNVSRKYPDFKTCDQVLHERMAQQPFVKYEDFDVAAFSDYGKMRYDKKESLRAAGGVQRGERMRRKRNGF